MHQGAIFDMDGLLFDTEPIFDQAWRLVANQYHLQLDQSFFDRNRGTSGAVMKQALKEFFPELSPDWLVQGLFDHTAQLTSQNVPLKKGVCEILDFLKQRSVLMAIASSSPKSMILHHLEVSGIRDYFDVIVSGEEVKRGKPYPDIFLLAASQLNLLPEDCYVFEDGLPGVRAGVKAGCETIMIPDMIQPTEDILSMPVQIFKDLLQAKDFIQKSS